MQKRSWSWPNSWPSYAQNNWWFTGVFYAISAVVGSVTSVLAHASMIWAFVRLAQNRIRLPDDRPTVWLAVAFALYPLSELISAIVNGRGPNGYLEILDSMIFLGLLPIVARLLESSRAELARVTTDGAMVGAACAFMFALFQFLVLGMPRPEAGSGNPNVLALTTTLLFGLCLIPIAVETGLRRKLAMIAALMVLFTTILTGARTFWPALILLLPVVGLSLIHVRSFLRIHPRTILLGLVVMTGFAMVAAPFVVGRFEAMLVDITALSSGQYNSSLGHRLLLWSFAIERVAEQPIFGYGPDAIRELMTAHPDSPGLVYTHMHNFVLTAMIRGGVVELAAILAILLATLGLALKPRGSAEARIGSAILLILLTTYLCGGLLGIFFDHDITHALFVYSAAIAARLLIPAEPAAQDQPEPGV